MFENINKSTLVCKFLNNVKEKNDLKHKSKSVGSFSVEQKIKDDFDLEVIKFTSLFFKELPNFKNEKQRRKTSSKGKENINIIVREDKSMKK